MRQITIATLALTAMLSLAACQQKQTATAAATPAPAEQVATTQTLTPEQLGELGGLIKNNPDRANELLAQHNMTRESFEKAVRDVTENVDASKRYAAAYKKTAA
ncbi:MAG: hypothetical protein ACJ74H_04980 [Thermoanaerobaculia bacterium]